MEPPSRSKTAGRPRKTLDAWCSFRAVRPASSRAGGTPTTARSGAGRWSSTTRSAASEIFSPLFHAGAGPLCLHEIGSASQVDQVRLEPRGAAQKVRHLVELVEDVARLASSQRPFEWLVIAVEHVLIADLVEHDLELLARPLEDLSEFDRCRIGHVDLVAHAPEKRFVDQRSRLEVGAEHDHGLRSEEHTSELQSLTNLV